MQVLIKNESAIVVDRNASTDDEDTIAELLSAVGRQVPSAQELSVQGNSTK